jgi:hypothetical protein
MTDATYTLHQALLRLAKGMIQAWERWVIVSSGSTELPLRTSRPLPARPTADAATQSSVSGDDRRGRSAVDRHGVDNGAEVSR